MSTFTDSGKIQDAFFNEVIYPYCGAQREPVIAGPEYGVDVSLVRLPNHMAMALTSDPLSLIPTLGLQESAWLSVQLMANDMATTGVAPMYAQLVLNLPPSFSSADFKEYWMYIHRFCTAIDVAITGGHTGKAEGQNSTIAGGGTMISVGPEDQFLLSKYARPGDAIIVTRQCAMIATSILAMSFPNTIKNKCGAAVYHDACGLFYETSSLQAGLCAVQAGDKIVTAMHDVTEGGVLGAIYELAIAAGCGAIIESASLPIGAAQQSIGELFGIDPRFCVGAGSMIITAQAGKQQQVIQHLKDNGIPAVQAGVLTVKDQGIIIHENGIDKELVLPGADPYWNAFFTALRNGWK